MLVVDRRRLFLRYGGHVWKVQETPKGSIALGTICIIPVLSAWVLIRRGITITIPKSCDNETFAQFAGRVGD